MTATGQTKAGDTPEPSPRGKKWLIPTLAVAGAMAIAAIAFGLGTQVSDRKGQSVTAYESTTVDQPTTTRAAPTTSQVPTTTLPPPTTTTAAPTTLPVITTSPPPTSPPATCVHGTVGIEDLRLSPGEYEDDYVVSGHVVNNTDAIWDFYGARVSVSTTAYPDREVESAALYADVKEIRPGERLPISGRFNLWPPGQKPMKVWWTTDWDDPYAFTGFPRVAEPWQFC